MGVGLTIPGSKISTLAETNFCSTPYPQGPIHQCLPALSRPAHPRWPVNYAHHAGCA
jgi:hypothetical protein